MKKGNVKTLLLEIILILIFFFALFASKIVSRYLVASILLITTMVLKKKWRTKSNEYIYGKQVGILMILFAIVYIATYYALGLHFGFAKSTYVLSTSILIRIIVPFTIIIINIELLRKLLLSQDATITIKGKKINISIALTYIITVLVDLIIYVGIYDLSTLESTLKIVGLVLFSTLSSNLLYNYITVRFGPKGIIVYRLITILFIYIIPIQPDVYIFFRSFLKMIYPFIIYIVLENTYAKNNLALSYSKRKKSIVSTTITILIMTLLIMLISCKFTYGIIVIGSKSMTGTINKGDAIIYKKYDGNSIKEGQVIMFERNNTRIIHRAIRVRNIDGKLQITTKGDANKEQDYGYVSKDDIKGIIKIRIKYIGKPTVWLNELFNNN